MAKKNNKLKKEPYRRSVTRFSFKSAFFILFSILLSTFVFPLILDLVGLDLRWLRVLIISLTSAFSFSYSLYVIERKEEIGKNFWIFFIVIALFTAFIAYFWVYDIYYI